MASDEQVPDDIAEIVLAIEAQEEAEEAEAAQAAASSSSWPRNRRINFTFLFGRRGQPCPADDEDRSSVQGSAGTGSRSAAHRDEL